MDSQKTLITDTPATVSVKGDEVVKKEWKQPTLGSLNIQDTLALTGPGSDNFERANIS